ncbi:head-tail joining protein [Desulforhopalus singaporensis]|uniref:Uncharacterized protein n=1 Tax=Desulforhopalus singaporensis TaxID=91360 RepID=A0A1H0NSU8_9BACT|nr:hypothetical protein [Desulforhopalus singaporensis]SDO95723.1 hypothetical protein SAMN05660330_01430 [Desulforhopalus singaporensis]
MTSFRDLQLSVLVDAFSPEKFGQVVNYNGTDLNAIFRSQGKDRDNRNGSADVGKLQVMKSDIPEWNYGDEVLVDGRWWKVKKEVEGSTWFKWMLHVERDVRHKP